MSYFTQKISGHSGTTGKPKRPFQYIHFGYLRRKRIPPFQKSEKRYIWIEPSNAKLLLRMGILLTLLIPLGLLSNMIVQNMIVGFENRERADYEHWRDERVEAYYVLCSAALINFENYDLERALEEASRAHDIFPSRIEANMILYRIMNRYCKSYGELCNETGMYLDYLDKYYALDRAWYELQPLAMITKE